MSQNNSPGFMYFNKPPVQQPSPTSDFMGFSESEPPSHSNQQQESPRFRHNKSRGFPIHNNWRKQQHRSNFNRSFSPNSSHNSSFGENSSFNNSSGSNSTFGCNSFNQSFGRRGGFNQSGSGSRSFLHPSFMEDPWADLVQQAERRKRVKEAELKGLSPVDD